MNNARSHNESTLQATRNNKKQETERLLLVQYVLRSFVSDSQMVCFSRETLHASIAEGNPSFDDEKRVKGGRYKRAREKLHRQLQYSCYVVA